jgi:hypothetical protein
MGNDDVAILAVGVAVCMLCVASVLDTLFHRQWLGVAH